MEFKDDKEPVEGHLGDVDSSLIHAVAESAPAKSDAGETRWAPSPDEERKLAELISMLSTARERGADSFVPNQNTVLLERISDFSGQLVLKYGDSVYNFRLYHILTGSSTVLNGKEKNLQAFDTPTGEIEAFIRDVAKEFELASL